MGHVAPPIAELTAQAQTLTSAGELVAARDVLADVLDPADTDPQRASPDLANAAALLARILIALGDPHNARIWAAFAHAAEDRLYGPHDERTVAAAALHAAVLHRVGNYGRAAQLYHDLVGELTALDGPDSARTLAAEADLATAEHASGHCTAARGRLTDAWSVFRQVYGDAHPAGIKMLARLGAMERECGRTTESREHLALVQELCARYLPGDHPLALQAAGLAHAPATGRHICGRVERSTGPASAPGVVPVHRPSAPGVRRTRIEPMPDDRHPAGAPTPPTGTPISPTYVPARPMPARPTGHTGGAMPMTPGQTSRAYPMPGQTSRATPMPPSGPPPGHGSQAIPTPPPGHGSRGMPTPPENTGAWGGPPPAGYAAAPPADPAGPVAGYGPPPAPAPAPALGPPRVGAWDDTPPIGAAPGGPASPGPGERRPGDAGEADHWPDAEAYGDDAYGLGPWDTAPDDRSTEPKGLYQQPLYLADVHAPPGERTGRHARADTPPPLPGQRAPERGPDGRPIRIGAAPVPPPARITPPDRRLPVPVGTEPEPRGSWQPLVLVAALITGVAVAAAVVIMTLPKAAGQENPPASPATTPSARVSASVAAGAPADVRLRDNRDSVSLDWDYPKGAEGPVLISGGRQGAGTRAFQTLPAGSTNYVVYGLNEGLDYCFTVSVAYSTARVVASAPQCTHRH